MAQACDGLEMIRLQLGGEPSDEPPSSTLAHSAEHNRKLIRAFCMASHPRVGAASAAQSLSAHVREKIVRHAGLMVALSTDYWRLDPTTCSDCFDISADGRSAVRKSVPGTDLLRGDTPLGPGIHQWGLVMSQWLSLIHI
eukprot:TRINITY_DN38947_c0_g1_i1.p1 TRINITY_DN38947_c0_g1~~TRINITY_DN38947_c0_g1_i1.p1  ORF type:complete len:140 (-),score=10.03 TRINITY_DN38947_c0_g1_i1:82-501(-)